MENFLSREMLEFLVMMSNYLMALCMGFYTLDCFWVFKYKNHSPSMIIYIRQSFWIFVIQLIGFFNLAYISKEWTYIILYFAMQLFLLIALCITPLIYRKMNYPLFTNMCMLLGIGMIILSRLSIDKAIRQFKIICIAYVFCMFVPLLLRKSKYLQKLTWVNATLGAVLLGLVLFISETTYGSKLSFTIEGLTFQPSEFVKILFVLFMAGALAQSTSLIRVLITSVIAGIHVLCLVLSTDLGSALIFFITYLAILFVASRNYIYLLLGIAGGCGASVLAFNLFSHVQVRVLAWLDPWKYIDNKGYQITQSLFAIGSGNWFGMGLHKGLPDDIPFVETDFIFSAVCEEFGTIFGICMMLVIIACFIMILRIALNTKNSFYRLTALGFGVLYIFQVFLTVGGGIKFIPLTGVTLPFISYGGSSMVSMMIIFFILHGIHMQSTKEILAAENASEQMEAGEFMGGESMDGKFMDEKSVDVESAEDASLEDVVIIDLEEIPAPEQTIEEENNEEDSEYEETIEF